VVEQTISHIEQILSEHRFPYPEGPREYQKEAYNNWVANDYKGIFAITTGNIAA